MTSTEQPHHMNKVGIEKSKIQKERRDMRQQKISLEKDIEQSIFGIRLVEDI